MSHSSTSQDPSLHNTADPTSASTGARSTRPQQPAWQSSHPRHTPRRGLTPISTGSTGHTRPGSSSGSPSRAAFSPTTSAFNNTSISANRQAASRHSSNSSNPSLVSPLGPGHHATSSYHSGQRSRAVTSTGSPRLASSFASLSAASQGGGPIAGTSSHSRLARHSPSLSGSTVGSPVSSTGGGSSGQLTSLLITQLNILLSTIKENNFESQAEKIRRLVDDNDMELFPTYFRRLLQSNASTVFPSSARSAAGNDSSGSYQMLVQEMQKIFTEPQQAEKIAQSLDTSEGELFRDFDLSTFIEHFRLDQISKVALALACRALSKPELRTKADDILTNNFQTFLSTVASPVPTQQNGQIRDDLSPLVLATIIERITQDPPPNWGEGQWESFNYSIHIRYRHLNMPMPLAVQSAFSMTDLLGSENGRLGRFIERTGPRGTANLNACKEMLAGVETRDISYPQIASALLFMVTVQDGDAYDPAIFVEGLRQHRAGPRIDWTDVVQGFDREKTRVTKKQFLGLYNALLPVAREFTMFDIQCLWGGKWEWPETQLSFLVAFLSTTPEELDVAQIPDLRQAFTLDDYRDAPESVKAYAAKAVKHPLVSTDAITALFNMIFQSQETYNIAQMMGIPDTLINPNMTMFVCAAASIEHPDENLSPLQDQALKQLFYPFLLKQHENYDFVMHSLWMHNKAWVAGRMVEFYQQDNMLLLLIYQHAEENGWLELLLTISSNFTLDLAAFAHGKGRCNLLEWSQAHINAMGPKDYGAALMVFLRAKAEDEANVQREQAVPTTPPLKLKTVHTLLLMITDLLPDERESGPLYRLCLQTYPRLFNYGEDEKRDAVIEASGVRAHSHALPEEAGGQMEDRYKRMYGGHATPDQVITELKDLKESEDAADQDLFAAMLHGLFDEYNCFGEYPNEALATTAVLFGGLIQFNVLSGIAEQAAIFMIFEAVSEYSHDDSMYRFGLQAMIHIIGRLKEWPQVAQRILVTASLQGTQPFIAAQNAIKELEQENIGLNGDVVNGIANGALDESFRVDSPTPTFSAIHVDPPLRPELYEEPDEDVSDKVMFVLNNVSKRNLEEKFKDLESTLEEKHHQWFARYLVEELAKSQPNFQALYLQLLESFNKRVLWAEVLRETYVSCAKMLNAQSTMDSATERTSLKNLAGWLGSLTLARNQPILHRSLSFRELLIEGEDSSRNIVSIPFTCKVLIHAASSKVFRPPNPWLMELLGLLSELYHFFELKINLKFEIEVLCRDLSMDIKNIEPLEIIRSRPLLAENNMLQQYVPDGGADGFADMHLMGLSKRAPNERFSPEAVIQALPDLGGMLQIPQAAGNVTQPQLRGIFVNAAQQAIYEIIAPVVERSVTIAAISTAELIQKDFATEADTEKLRGSAHTVVKALSGSLALVTCKEPLRMSIMNNIRILAARSLPEQLPEGQIIMFVNDNIDTVCSLVERAAEEHSLAEIDAQLAQALLERRQHNESRPNEPFNQPPVSRWAQLIPDPFRQDPQGGNASGLNRQQLGLYEDFGRQARITPAAHAISASQDTNRQLPDVLSDSYLPNMPTPAEAPALPRQTPQQRMQGMPPSQQHQMNGYLDNANIGQRTLDLMQDLQQASREAPEEHISEIGEAAPIRRIFEQLIDFIGSNVQKDTLANAAGQQCFMAIYSEAQKRLEIEVFVRLLVHLCKISVHAGRNLTMYLASADDDKLFNAGAALALLGEGMLEIQHIDIQASKALRARRPAVLGFLGELLDEVLLSDHAVALRSDFVLTYEALGQWIADEPSNEAARDIMSKLQIPANQQNGMPSPPQQDRHDQLEYIFEEWVRLQRKDTPERSYLAFVRQLYENHVVTEPNATMAFFRACLEMSCSAFERVTSAPYATQDAAYVHIDALAKLIAFLVLYQSPVDGEPQVNKAKSLDAFLRLVILVMNDQHHKQRERWNSRVYFRLLSSLLCELHAGKSQLSVQQEQEVYQKMAEALQVLQPRHFPGFIYPWLGLLSHRLFVPAFLNGQGRINGGWETYAKLLCTLFLSLGQLLESSDTSVVVQDFYRGVLRFLLMLHHDFPEFLIENHLQLNSSIPVGCAQLHNIVNSAVTRAVMNDQPDPFMPGLKINRLEQVRQAPAVNADYGKFLEEAGMREAAERICTGTDISNDDYTTIATALGELSGPAAALASNALVLSIGVQATSASSVFSSAAAPARLLERLLRETSPPLRYQLIVALLNQVRYVNAHTHYFSTAIQHLFGIVPTDVQEQMMRVLVERLMVARPHPWGVIVLILEMVKNNNYDVWSLPFMKTAPQVQQMLAGLAQSQERVARSPGAM